MFLKAILVLSLALVLGHIYNLYGQMEYNIQHHKHRPRQCKKIPGIVVGSEDLDLLSNGQVFITSGLCGNSLPPGYLDFYKESNKTGGIFLIDLKKHDFESIKSEEIVIVPSPNFDKSTFCPHGISVLEDANGRAFVYVVNHVLGEEDRIEKFCYKPEKGTLEHERSFRDSDLLGTVNDIAVVEEDKFYATNSLYSSSYPYSMLEGLLLVSWGDLVYFDGTRFRQEVSGLSMPNGVTSGRTGSPSEGLVYLNLDRHLHVFRRNSPDNSLELLQDISLHTIPDNSALSVKGDVLYIGAHPIRHRLLDYLMDPNKLAPSHILELPLSQGRVRVKDIQQLLFDDGEFISGSSVAVSYEDTLLVGTVISDMFVCKLNM